MLSNRNPLMAAPLVTEQDEPAEDEAASHSEWEESASSK